MEHQADPSAPMRLLDLPVSCLHHIVSFMDKETRLQFFRSSKGSRNEPGCAVLVLRASKLQFTCYVQSVKRIPRPALCSLLHWASQIRADVELKIASWDGAGFQLLPVLHSLLLYPDARATPSGRVLGKPATYPGVTRLTLGYYTCSSLIPDLVADAFPNLKSLEGEWRPNASQPLGPVLERGLQSVKHVSIDFTTSRELKPAASQHIAQQLSHMPSLTSMNVSNQVFIAVPAAVLAKLKKLALKPHVDDPTAEDKAALKACSQLESLHIPYYSYKWVPALPLHAPSIRALNVPIIMTDEHVSSLLALPHLTTLTVNWLNRLSEDYSSAPCSWKHFQCRSVCTSHITKLPLHSLDSPVECAKFCLTLSDHSADLAAIRAAKPQLLRCGGVKTHCNKLVIDMPSGSRLTKEQTAEVLAEWAPCLSVPQCIRSHASLKPIIEDAVARLWPRAELSCWEWEDSDEESDDWM